MKLFQTKSQTCDRRRGIVFFEYILLVTIIGIGAIVGLACVRYALVHELKDVAYSIHHIHNHYGDGYGHGDGYGGYENGHGDHGNGNGHNGDGGNDGGGDNDDGGGDNDDGGGDDDE